MHSKQQVAMSQDIASGKYVLEQEIKGLQAISDTLDERFEAVEVWNIWPLPPWPRHCAYVSKEHLAL